MTTPTIFLMHGSLSHGFFTFHFRLALPPRAHHCLMTSTTYLANAGTNMERLSPAGAVLYSNCRARNVYSGCCY